MYFNYKKKDQKDNVHYKYINIILKKVIQQQYKMFKMLSRVS